MANINTMSLTCAKMRELLRNANIKGRSSAKTSEQLLSLCKTHKLLPDTESEAVETVEPVVAELPFDILREVIKLTVYQGVEDVKYSSKSAKNLCSVLFNLKIVCKEFRDMLPANHEYWLAILETFAKCKDHCREALEALQYVKNGKISAQRALQLVVGTGCENCNCKRIRKVSWPFFKRWCQPCVESLTVADYKLKDIYKIEFWVYGNLPFILSEMYNRQYGAYTIKCYLTESVLDNYRRFKNMKHVTSLAQIENINQITKQNQHDVICKMFQEKSYSKYSIAALKNNHRFNDLFNMEFGLAKAQLNNPAFITEICNDVYNKELNDSVRIWVRELRSEIGKGQDGIPEYSILNDALNKFKYYLNKNTIATRELFIKNVWTKMLPELHTQALAVIDARKVKKEELRIKKERIAEELRIRKAEEQRLRQSTEELNEFVASLPHNSGRYKCPICEIKRPTNRDFLLPGLKQHIKDVHKNYNLKSAGSPPA